ncbi:hypothetical protein [Lysobacter sp. F60174L2]|uniref:hypothetical protein n=1 Tax=Lysobacter sp. F60174L2 TaxID=3459295 RepID=UPI00403D5ACD
MIPALPLARVKQAMEAGDWDRASALLTEHERTVRETIATAPPDARNREAWLGLLHAQRELVEQLSAARNEAGSALQRLRQANRGAAAYKGALG